MRLVETWGPTPPDTRNYAVEMLYAILGTGCEEVTHISGAGGDQVSGRWLGGPTGTAWSAPSGKGWGATVTTSATTSSIKIGQDFRSLLVEIVKFFETSQPPVPNDETLEIFEFLDAAQRSRAAGGAPMKLR